MAAVLQPGDKVVADANTGWLKHEAMRVVGAVKDVDVYIEQPAFATRIVCPCASTDLPFVMDESIDGIPEILQGEQDLAAGVVNIKISKFEA